MFPPSIWGKLKTNVQFAAILLAILRYDEPLGPLLLDEWAMIVVAITVMSAVEYLTLLLGPFRRLELIRRD